MDLIVNGLKYTKNIKDGIEYQHYDNITKLSKKQKDKTDISELLNDIIPKSADLLYKNKYKEVYELFLDVEKMSDIKILEFNKMKYKNEFINLLINLISVNENTNEMNKDKINLTIILLTIFCDFTDNSVEFRKYLCNHNFLIELINFCDLLLKKPKIHSVNNQLLELTSFIIYNIYSNIDKEEMMIKFHIDFNIDDTNINLQTKIALSATKIYNISTDDKYKQFLREIYYNKVGNYAPFTKKEIGQCLWNGNYN